MNTNQLKRFAQEARKKLINQIAAKLELVLTTDSAELREKTNQIQKLQEAINGSSKEQVVDKVAYTWFNRFMTLRFMDVNGYQPINIQVVSPKVGYTLPELLDEAKQGNIPEELNVKRQYIYDVLDGNIKSSNAQNEAYKELLIGACNHLHTVFPFLFEKINDYTELLLPEDLTSEFSILQDIRDGMTTEDCQEVEIIGWLYQFYISERKDEVFASKSKVKKEDIPAATQLFTPRWIVEYMVQNTVGKLWLQNKPNSTLRNHMPYFIESPSVTQDDYLKINSPEEITLLDQSCGSGHILVYGFELLSKIYEEEGYNPSEIPQLIIEKNLFGFEIDERAAQLAGMALLLKARSYHRRIFRKTIQPNILCYQDVKLEGEDLNTTFKQLDIELSEELKHDLKNTAQATNLGSLIIPHTDTKTLKTVLVNVEAKLQQTTDIFLKNYLQQLQTTLKQLVLLGTKYHCVVANPPYMGGGKMNKEMSSWVKNNYPDSKADLFSCFIERSLEFVPKHGFNGLVTMESWMFLSSFERLREKLLDSVKINSLSHFGWHIMRIAFGTVSFILENDKPSDKHKGVYSYLNINNIDKQKERPLEFPNKNNGRYNLVNQKDFEKIPGKPIGYWLNDSWFEVFKKNSISQKAISDGQNITGNNEKYIRFLWEVNSNLINKNSKWPKMAKGGEFRRWSGNIMEVVDWSDVARSEYKSNTVGRIQSSKLWFRKGITWNLVSSAGTGFRILQDDCLFNKAAPTVLFSSEDESKILCLLGFLNTKVSTSILKLLNPTINTNIKEILLLPYDFIDINPIVKLVEDSIIISDIDWNLKETSHNFVINELIKHQSQDLEETYALYQQYWKNKFFQLHKNEEEINKQFIEIYGLGEELTPDVPLEDITILKEETKIENNQLVFQAKEVFAQFVSYAVGCMFGRYSLDKSGLILANQGETLEDYLTKVEKSEDAVSFLPDDDNIIPLLDDEWFEDDIVGRFYEFLKVSFGTENFDKNIAFVEECLGKNIRKYFVKDFYKDHIKRYKKRPIYWQFSSPKGSFNVLIYMHRYTPDTLNEILNGYLVEYREKLKIRTEQLDHIIETGSATEQTKAEKEKDKLKIVLLELQEYERDVLYPLATERIAIDLDDGVLVNYNKFGDAIKKVAGLNDKKAKDKVRKFDWIDTTLIK